MTGLLNSLRTKLARFEKRDFYFHIGAFGGAVIVLSFSILYYYYSSIASLKSQLKKMNNKREESALLLKRFKRVNKQSQTINSLLTEEKTFKIKNFFDELLHSLHVEKQLSKETEISEEILHKRYTEIRLIAEFKGLSMQQLCEILNGIEEKERLYTKELIIKKTRGAVLDVSLKIATLKPQSGAPKG